MCSKKKINYKWNPGSHGREDYAQSETQTNITKEEKNWGKQLPNGVPHKKVKRSRFRRHNTTVGLINCERTLIPDIYEKLSRWQEYL